MNEPEAEGVEFAPKEIEVETLPEDFPAETPEVDAEPEVEGLDVAPVEMEVEAPIISEAKDPGVSMSSDGGAVQETPFRTQ